VRSLVLIPRDSISPGDSCGGVGIHKPKSGTITLPGADGAYVNSCGTQFGEWVDDIYYGNADETVESPLAFQIDMKGSSDAKVTLKLYLPPTS